MDFADLDTARSSRDTSRSTSNTALSTTTRQSTPDDVSRPMKDARYLTNVEFQTTAFHRLPPMVIET